MAFFILLTDTTIVIRPDILCDSGLLMLCIGKCVFEYEWEKGFMIPIKIEVAKTENWKV